MQRLAQLGEVAVGLDQRARLEPALLTHHERLDQRPEGLTRPHPRMVLLAGRIAAEADTGQHVLGARARLADVEFGERAEAQLAGLAGDCVLHPVRAITGTAQPQAEAGQVVVEVDLVVDAVRQGETGDGGGGQLHGARLLWVQSG